MIKGRSDTFTSCEMFQVVTLKEKQENNTIAPQETKLDFFLQQRGQFKGKK